MIFLGEFSVLLNESHPCDQGTKIGVPKVFRRIPRNSFTNICGVPRNSDSYPPNTLAIRARGISGPEKWTLKHHSRSEDLEGLTRFLCLDFLVEISVMETGPR